MKRHAIFSALSIVLLFLIGAFPAMAQQDQQEQPVYPREDGFYCPYGGYGMGPGYGRGWEGMPRGGYGPGPGYGYERGYGRGPGMMYRRAPMGRGYGMHRGMGPGMMWGPGYRGYGAGPETERGWYGPGQGYEAYDREPLNRDDAASIVEDYLDYTRNPNLELGNIEERENAFEAEIVTRDGSLVDRLRIDKQTGAMRPSYDDQ